MGRADADRSAGRIGRGRVGLRADGGGAPFAEAGRWRDDPSAKDRGATAGAILRRRIAGRYAGAARALAHGRSLLPAGVRDVEGEFERGDPVTVVGPGGEVLARGLSAYAAPDVRRIAGYRSEQIEALLGWRGRDEVVHRDDLVLL